MSRLARFINWRVGEYMQKKRIRKDVAAFVEDLNFWLDNVFLYQRGKSQRQAERFIRELSAQVTEELDHIICDREPEISSGRKRTRPAS